MQVMGWASVADPATLGTTPCPSSALFFSVAPYPEVDSQGEPQQYIGNVTKVSPYCAERGLDLQRDPTTERHEEFRDRTGGGDLEVNIRPVNGAAFRLTREGRQSCG